MRNAVSRVTARAVASLFLFFLIDCTALYAHCFEADSSIGQPSWADIALATLGGCLGKKRGRGGGVGGGILSTQKILLSNGARMKDGLVMKTTRTLCALNCQVSWAARRKKQNKTKL